jgi:hypothetical protein
MELVRTSGRWAAVVTHIEGVYVQTFSDGERMQVVVRTVHPDPVVIEVLDPDGLPIGSALFPAGRTPGEEMTADISVRGRQVVARVSLLGDDGHVLAVSEVGVVV